jgi:hypothetical protein
LRGCNAAPTLKCCPFPSLQVRYVVKTRPVSTHRDPAFRRSSSCVFLCVFRASTQTTGSANVRRLFAVFRSWRTSRFPTRCSCCLMCSPSRSRRHPI